ncbi:MAG: sugar phosphate nucleotidyltransferase, partial [Bacilli bacterium]
MNKIRKLVIPVAGLGTRFLPATKSMPKEMLSIIDKPTIQYIVEEAVASGIKELLFITSPYKKAIEDHFDKSYELEKRLEKSSKKDLLKEVQNISDMIKIYYVRQGEPLGSGHAINLAKTFIGDEYFAVMFGDDLIVNDKPALKQLI